MITIGNERLDAFINEKLEAILKELDRTNPLEMYWDRNDQLSEKQINTIVNEEDGWNTVENEIHDNNYDYIVDMGVERIEEQLKKYCTENDIRFLDCNEIAEEIREEFIDYLSVKIDIEELANRTPLIPVRITRYSNYDCINSHSFEGSYGYEDTYFGAVVDALNLNPKKVKQQLKANSIETYGTWPNKQNRNNKEFVTYEDFVVEVENRTCPGSLIVILGMLNINEVHKQHNRIEIPKGNRVGFFSSAYGGGSVLDMLLTNDIHINTKPGETEYDRWELCIDTNDGDYSVENTYGVSKEFFGKEIKISKTK